MYTESLKIPVEMILNTIANDFVDTKGEATALNGV